MHAAWAMIHRLRAQNVSDEERDKILSFLTTAALEEEKNLNSQDQIVHNVKV